MSFREFDPEQCFPKMTEELYAYVIARDSECCVMCGDRGASLHHVIYKSHGGKNKANNLATVCLIHHDKIHNKNNKIENLVELLIKRIQDNETLFRKNLL